MQHHGDGASLLLGLVSILVSKVMGLITIASIGQAFILGAAGAAGGWCIKKAGEFIIYRIKQYLKNRKSKSK